MDGMGPPHESRRNDTDWAGTGFQPSTEPITPDRGGRRRKRGPPTSESNARPSVDELEERLDRREADLQQVIDRYETVLDDRRTGSTDRGERPALPRRVLRSVRTRVEQLRTDVAIALRYRRE